MKTSTIYGIFKILKIIRRPILGLIFLILCVFLSLIYCNQVKQPDTAENLRQRANELYNEADKMVGQIDSIFEATFPYDSFPGLKRDDSYKTKMLVITSWDSSGHRKRIIQYIK